LIAFSTSVTFASVPSAATASLIGAHMLGNPASELIVIAGIAIEKGMKSDELKSFVFPHPTVGEIIKEALY
jgi:dihydrolipoamide dehydrogenase